MGEGATVTGVAVDVGVAPAELTTVAPAEGVGDEARRVGVAGEVATVMGVSVGTGVRLGVGDGVGVNVGVAGRGV